MLVKSPPAGQSAELEAPEAGLLPHDKPSPRFAFAPLIQGLAYVVLCLIAIEGLFALAHVGESEYLMPDKICGFTLMPSKVITQRAEGFGSFKSNSYGMQDDQITLAKPPGVMRIAVFGDSYVESLHVARSANFLQVTARNLAEKLHQPVQVLNFGVSNYSVAQDYLRYQTLAKKFNPDLVVQVFRVEESDKLLPQPSNYLSLVRPVFFVGEHGELVYDDSHVRAFFNSSTGKKMLQHHWLRHDSRLWCVIGQFSQTLASFGKSKAAPVAIAPSLTVPGNMPASTSMAISPAPASASAPAPTVPLSNKERYISCYWYMMDKQLEAFKNEALANGSAFMILRTPMIKAEMDGLRVNKTESTLLASTAKRIGAPVLNLDTDFKNQFGLKNDGTHFLSGGHFNKNTHQWVGQNLSAYLFAHSHELGLNNSLKNDQSTTAASK